MDLPQFRWQICLGCSWSCPYPAHINFLYCSEKNIRGRLSTTPSSVPKFHLYHLPSPSPFYYVNMCFVFPGLEVQSAKLKKEASFVAQRFFSSSLFNLSWRGNQAFSFPCPPPGAWFATVAKCQVPWEVMEGLFLRVSTSRAASQVKNGVTE